MAERRVIYVEMCRYCPYVVYFVVSETYECKHTKRNITDTVKAQNGVDWQCPLLIHYDDFKDNTDGLAG